MKAWILACFLVVVAFPGWSSTVERVASVPVSNGNYVEAFLEYRLGIQLRIEEAWAGYLKTYGGSLPRGRAVFTYHVNPDGKITLVEPKAGGNPILTALAHRAIIEANAELIAFPEVIRERHASGYFNQIVFALK